MSLADRPPGARKSLSATDLNTFDPSSLGTQPLKAKKRAYMSFGGEGLAGLPGQEGMAVSASLESVKAQSGEIGKGEELSPRRKARRALQPRKSILKPLAINNISNENEDETETFTFHGDKLGHAHTVAFGRDGEHTGRVSLASRRVSFAPSAHVRMINIAEQGNRRASAVGFSSRSSGSRRSSTGRPVTIAFAPSAPAHHNIRFNPEGESQGEASMDLETDSEGSEDDFAVGDENVVESSATAFEGEDDEEGDEEMSMEGTQVYGGIVRRQSTQATGPAGVAGLGAESSFVSEASTAEGEEKTMEFTIAIGGLIPHSPPVGANRGRQSIGYNFPLGGGAGTAFRPGTAMEGEVDVDGAMDMDETVALGGIIGADESLSDGSDEGTEGGRTMTFSLNAQSQAQAQVQGKNQASARLSVASRQSMVSEADVDEDGMDFTQMGGGIIGQFAPAVSPARSARPSMGGTPSFARPTQSSAQKAKSNTPNQLNQSQSNTTAKRNVFAPSPSPAEATPRKAGMEVAGEVAKRLSFGSVTSSGGAAGHKRARSDGALYDDEHEPPASTKRARTMTLGDSVFGSASRVAVSPARPKSVHVGPTEYAEATSGTPRRVSNSSIANRSATPAKLRLSSSTSGTHLPPRSPFKSPFRKAIAQTAGLLAPSSGEDDADSPDPNTLEPIRLATFLHNAGIEFMDRLPTARRRQSTARGVLGRSVNGAGEREFGLHEYAEAEVHKIWWRFYDWAARKVLDDINARQTELGEMEETYDRLNPPVVQEYLSATEDDRQLFEMTFKAFKTNTQLKARGGWYDWKMGIVEAMRPNVEEVLEDMRVDHERLHQQSAEAEDLLPQLRDRYEAIQAELQRERQIAEELAMNDRAEIADYKEAIHEQGTQIEGFTAELNEVTAKLSDLQSKLEEQTRQKVEHLAAIADAKSRCGQFSRSDVARLQDEYQSIQSLHMWRVSTMSATALELVINDELSLRFDCVKHIPRIGSAKLGMLDSKEGKRSKKAEKGKQERKEGMYSLLQAALEGLKATSGMNGQKGSLSQFIQSFSTLYTASLHIRSELSLLSLRHPVRIHQLSSSEEEEPALVVSAALVLPPAAGASERGGSKVFLEWRVDVDTLVRWPDGVGEVDVRARTIYGPAEEDVMSGIATETMASAVAEGYQGVFASCCMDVLAHYAA